MTGAAVLTMDVLAAGRSFPAGTERSGEAAELVGDGPWWSGPAAGVVASTQDAEPPRSGKGSGVEAWREYAEAKGIPFDAEATRDDIIALVDGQQA